MEDALVGCLWALIMAALSALVNGLALMVAVDIANDHWLSMLPNLGYWTAVCIAFFINCAFTTPNRSSKK